MKRAERGQVVEVVARGGLQDPLGRNLTFFGWE